MSLTREERLARTHQLGPAVSIAPQFENGDRVHFVDRDHRASWKTYGSGVAYIIAYSHHARKSIEIEASETYHADKMLGETRDVERKVLISIDERNAPAFVEGLQALMIGEHGAKLVRARKILEEYWTQGAEEEIVSHDDNAKYCAKIVRACNVLEEHGHAGDLAQVEHLLATAPSIFDYDARGNWIGNVPNENGVTA